MTNEIVKTGLTGSFGEEGSFELAQREAKAFSSSQLVPEQYRDNVPNTLIAMEIARRIGASVLAVMQNLYVVHGKPGFGSAFLIATVNACGRFSPIRYKMTGEEGQMTWGCRAYASDRETGEVCEGPLVTMKMANDEGWLGKSGSKWKTMPELMLRYRAAAFWTRVFAPELSLGMQTAEEREDVSYARDFQNENLNPIDAIKQRLAEKQAEKKWDNLPDAVQVIKNVETIPRADEKSSDEFPQHPADELSDLAKKMFGTKHKEELSKLATENGIVLVTMTDEQASLLVSILKGYEDERR